jgi:uncharacterized short protein YbdD (DUF466 family)
MTNWRQWFERGWRGLRTIVGDDAYERYVEHMRSRHPHEQPLERGDFYLREQERRFSSGPTRCC